jgi:isopenicillin N synthase-like dioxygenase
MVAIPGGQANVLTAMRQIVLVSRHGITRQPHLKNATAVITSFHLKGQHRGRNQEIHHKERSMTDRPRKVPRLSLRQYTAGKVSARQEFSEQLHAGLRDFGFVILYDHPIDLGLLHSAYRESEKLFNLNLPTKKKYDAAANGGQRGYTAFGVEHAKDAAAIDLKEFWHVGQDLFEGHKYYKSYAPNVWPGELPAFKKTFIELYRGLEETGKIMLRALAPQLKVPDDFFDTLTKDGNSILRLLHYPPIPETADPRSIRAAAHEDINLITLLVSASASGLQLMDRDGQWLDVVGEPDDIIVDTGDMLARITNDLLPATTHRVINPVDAKTSRYSMPFFMHPHPEAILSCIPSCRGAGAKYPDISSHAFLMQRLKEIGLLK